MTDTEDIDAIAAEYVLGALLATRSGRICPTAPWKRIVA